MKESVWYGCYEKNWVGLAVPASLRHPAKIAPLLAKRIYEYLIENGFVKKNDLILDPFGGIAGTALYAMTSGLRWVCIELEPHFVELGRVNLEHWDKTYGLSGATLLQGDSRRLIEILSNADACVSSPPYCNSPIAHVDNSLGNATNSYAKTGKSMRSRSGGDLPNEQYGAADGQLGAMQEGDVSAVVSSPPYGDVGLANIGDNATPEAKIKRLQEEGKYKEAIACMHSSGKNANLRCQGYGHTDGNLADLPYGDISGIVSSPPYAETIQGANAERETSKDTRDKRKTEGGSLGVSQRSGGYGITDGNLSGLQVGDFDSSIIKLDAQEIKENYSPEGSNSLLGIQPSEAVLIKDAQCLNNSAKIAAQESVERAVGVNHAVESMSQPLLKEDQSRQVTGPKSQPPNSTNPCQIVGDQHILSGMAGQIVGEDTLGEVKEKWHWSGMGTNAEIAERTNVCKSITKEMPGKQMENGIIPSTTSKPYVADATANDTGNKLHMKKCVQSVEPNSKLMNQELSIANVNAEKKQLDNPNLDSIEKTQEPLSVLTAGSTSAWQDTDISIVPENACKERGQKKQQHTSSDSNTFWMAAREIVIQCHHILKHGGYCVWVVKRFIRNGQIVDFSDQWRQLCESCGFEMVEWIRASFVNEWEEDGLFGIEKKRKKRSSFFRKNYEKKHPENAIDWEDILVMRKPVK